MSSPTERKVSYAQVIGAKASANVIKPLVDAGLVAPFGIALDMKRVWLYVADTVQHKIFHYKLKVEEHFDSDTDTSNFTLSVDGYPVCVAQDVQATWVAVDRAGNLFFTVEDKPKSIDKIQLSVIEQLIDGNIAASQLLVKTGRETNGDPALGSEAESLSSPEPIMTRLYEEAPDGVEGACPDNLAMPGGIVTSGDDLWFTNQKNGFTKGAVVHGKATVQPPMAEASAWCSNAVTNQTNVAYGLVVTNTLFIYSSGPSVYAVSRTNGVTKTLSSSVYNVRGIAWDGDNTCFIADREANALFSMPCGQLRDDAPLEPLFPFHDPFGLALLPGAKAANVKTRIVSGDGGTAVEALHKTVEYFKDLVR